MNAENDRCCKFWTFRQRDLNMIFSEMELIFQKEGDPRGSQKSLVPPSLQYAVGCSNEERMPSNRKASQVIILISYVLITF